MQTFHKKVKSTYKYFYIYITLLSNNKVYEEYFLFFLFFGKQNSIDYIRFVLTNIYCHPVLLPDKRVRSTAGDTDKSPHPGLGYLCYHFLAGHCPQTKTSTYNKKKSEPLSAWCKSLWFFHLSNITSTMSWKYVLVCSVGTLSCIN